MYEMPSYQPVELQADGEDGTIVLFSGVVTELNVEISSEVSIVRIKERAIAGLWTSQRNHVLFKTRR